MNEQPRELVRGQPRELVRGQPWRNLDGKGRESLIGTVWCTVQEGFLWEEVGELSTHRLKLRN